MIEWNETWKTALAASNQVNRMEDYYEKEERAEMYDRSENIRLDGERRVAALNLDPSWSVLDIGCGPGTMALPLARKVRQVTIVEPSLVMIRYLEKRMTEEKRSNIKILHSKWEDLSKEDAGMHDVVIASYSLVFEDLEEALRKMNRVARQRVYLYWFAGTAPWEKIREDLYPVIFGRRYIPGPKCDIIYGLLHSLGLFSDVAVLESTSFPREYSSIDEAVSDIRNMLNLSCHDHDGLLRRYIENRFLRLGDGDTVVLDDDTNYVRLSWRPKALDEWLL